MLRKKASNVGRTLLLDATFPKKSMPSCFLLSSFTAFRHSFFHFKKPNCRALSLFFMRYAPNSLRPHCLLLSALLCAMSDSLHVLQAFASSRALSLPATLLINLSAARFSFALLLNSKILSDHSSNDTPSKFREKRWSTATVLVRTSSP